MDELERAKQTRDAIHWSLCWADGQQFSPSVREGIARMHELWKREVNILEVAEKQAPTMTEMTEIEWVKHGLYETGHAGVPPEMITYLKQRLAELEAAEKETKEPSTVAQTARRVRYLEENLKQLENRFALHVHNMEDTRCPKCYECQTTSEPCDQQETDDG